jgi:phenylalanyl-tRNA synthetase beta chain
MQFSKNWLNEFVDVDISIEELCGQLTMAGLEVDGYETYHSKILGKDTIIKLDITPNRGDCFSVLGIAREVAIANNLKLKMPLIKKIKSTLTSPTSIRVCNEAPVYAGRYIRNINLSAKTNPLIAERLETSDHRLIDPVVDITNYILLELGQPLHAFDHEKIDGDIRVRYAKEKENLTLLDETEVALSKDCLVIADKKKPIAFAGIMGGLNSSVTSDTKSIFLESAFFKPEVIRGKARRYGMQTDASMRFERGVDYELQEIAIARASTLLNETVGGEYAPIQITQDKKNLPKKIKVSLDIENANNLLGYKFSNAKAQKYFKGLGLDPKSTGKKINTTCPSWRYDLNIESDLIEELARLEGYDKLPQRSLQPLLGRKKVSTERLVSNFFVSQGYNEVITYSFIDENDADLIQNNKNKLKVSNPISQNMNVMRPSLWPGLLSTYIKNYKNGKSDQKIFEIGSIFLTDSKGKVDEVNQVSGLISGNFNSIHWDRKPEPLNFFDLKGDLEKLSSHLKLEFSFQEMSTPFLHPGKTASITLNNKKMGYLGALHPNIINLKGLKSEVYLFSLNLGPLNPNDSIKYKEFSRFPSSQRDLAFVVDRDVSNLEITKLIKSKAGKDLTDLIIFDVYQGKGIPENKKSIAYTLRWQSKDRTLVDGEVDRAVENIVNFLNKKIKAEIRE